jgi:Acetyltransferase (GNAT) domain
MTTPALHNFEVPVLDSRGKKPAPAPASAVSVQVYAALDDLPAPFLRLFHEAGRRSFFLTLPWFQNLARTALDKNDRVRIYGIARAGDAEAAAGMFVGRCLRETKGTRPLRKLCALTNFYSVFFAPHLSEPAGHAQETLQALAHVIAREKPAWDVIDIQPLGVDAEEFSALGEAFRTAGFVVQTFFCFGNWYLPVNGRTFAQYLESLPSALKNTLNRKRKKLEQSGRATIQILTGGEALEPAIEAYTKVYLASWKRPEPYPEFTPGLIRLCGDLGALRLGLVHVDGEPAAAQLWIVHNQKAMIYKLAYDERFVNLSVGTILTAALMQRVLDIDKVDEVDYLSGDDAYKRDWMSHRRERWGLLAMNPRTPRGALAIARHVGGRAAKRSLSWLTRRWRRGDDAPIKGIGSE